MAAAVVWLLSSRGWAQEPGPVALVAIEDGTISHRAVCGSLQGHQVFEIVLDPSVQTHEPCPICTPDGTVPVVEYAKETEGGLVSASALDPADPAISTDPSASVADSGAGEVIADASAVPSGVEYLVDRFAEPRVWVAQGGSIFHRDVCVTLQGHPRVAVDRFGLDDRYTACPICRPRGVPSDREYLPAVDAPPVVETVADDADGPVEADVEERVVTSPDPSAGVPVDAAPVADVPAADASPEASSSPEPPPEPSYVSADGAVSLSITSTITATTESWAVFSWALTASNTGGSAAAFDVEIEFQDQAGDAVATDAIHGLVIPAAVTRSVSGITRVAASLAPSVIGTVARPATGR